MKKVSVILILALTLALLPPGGAATVSQAQDGGCDLTVVVSDVGQFAVYNMDAAQPPVYLVQELHDLVDARLESAILIDRLMRLCNVQLVGLEGTFPDTDFDTTWFRGVSLGMVIESAVQLLGQGEINQGEFGALVYPALYPDYAIYGTDDKALYNKLYDDSGWGDLDLAMLYTGIALLDDDQLTVVFEIFDRQPGDDDPDEVWNAWLDEVYAATYPNNPNEKIRTWYARSNPEREACTTVSVEGEIALYDLAVEIVLENAEEVEVFWGESIADMATTSESMREFYEDAHERSVVMVREIETLNTRPEGMIAITGAGHTEWMRDQLVADGYPVVVVSSNGLCDDTNAVRLSTEQWADKLNATSVDEPGQLGFVIVNGKNPPSVLPRMWLRIKGTLVNVGALATYALNLNPGLTLAEILDGINLPPGITVDDDSLVESDEPGIYSLAVSYNVSDPDTGDVFHDTIYLGINTNQQTPATWDSDDASVAVEPALRAKLAEVDDDNVPPNPDNVSDLGNGIKMGFGKTRDSAVQAAVSIR